MDLRTGSNCDFKLEVHMDIILAIDVYDDNFAAEICYMYNRYMKQMHMCTIVSEIININPTYFTNLILCEALQ